MRILPKSRDEWIALPLFPFKMWVAFAFPAYVFAQPIFSGQHVHGTEQFGLTIVFGYALSVLVLLLGALIQSIICRRGAATQTVLYAVTGILLVLFLFGH